MAAHPQVSLSDARDMVDYILSLNDTKKASQPITAAYVRPSGALINAGGRAQAITYDGLEEDAIAGGARGAFSPTFTSASSSSSSSRDSAAKKRQRDEKDAARAEKDAAKAAAKEAAKEAAREASMREAAAKEAAAKEAAKDSTK